MPPGNQYLTARRPWVPELGYVLHADADRQEELFEDLQADSGCSEEVKTIAKSARRKPLLCFIGFKKGLITHVARGEVRYHARSGRDRLDLWNVEELAKPVSVAALRQALARGRSLRADVTLRLGGSLSPKAFQQVLVALRRIDAEAAAAAERLIDPTAAAPATEDVPQGRINWGLQRDAAVTALEIAGIPRDRLEVRPQPAAITSAMLSIFDDVGDLTAVEDHLVFNDLEGDAEWILLKRHKYPARTFDNGETTLTVILANKEALEVLAGVDLIYVNETLNSVVFVQYKIFRGEGGKEGYRPDKQLAKEIRRMDAVATAISKAAADLSCDGYRLGSDPFFFKFCTKLLEQESEGHVPGYYIPLGYWKRLASDARVKGPRGGIHVTSDNLGRHLTPTTFVELVKRGWIGTTVDQSAVVMPALRAAMAGDRGLVLAIETKAPKISIVASSTQTERPS